MSAPYRNFGRGRDMPPKWKYVEIYFLQCKKTEKEASEFYQHYSRRFWRSPTGEIIRDWKRLAWHWIWIR